jgi:hypothetical protein
VLNRIFRLKRDEVVGGRRRLRNEELHNLYTSPNIMVIKSRTMRFASHVASMGKMKNAYKIFVGIPEVKRPLGRPKRRWENYIRMDLRKVSWQDMNWMHLA